MQNKDDLRVVIDDVTRRMNMHSDGVVELLMGTCAVESNLGTYDEQIGNGPALGIFQIEPSTMYDIFNNYIKYRGWLRILLAEEFGIVGPDKERLQNDIEYGIVMARLKYRRSPLAIPKPDNIKGLAYIWKKVYNTDLGKGKMIEFITKYKKYCI